MGIINIIKWLFFSCLHYPLVDTAAEAWLLDTVADYRPDVIVHGGDGHEADSASRWPSEYTWDLEDEFVQHNEFLRKVREAYAPARRVFLPGNHEANILGLNRINSKLRSLCDYRKLEPELDHWEQPAVYEYSRRGIFRLGQVTFFHGYEAGVSADEMQGYNLGLPYGLTVSGHTHRPLAVTQALRTKGVPLPYWYANAGCLRDMVDVPYMERKRRHLWGHGLVIGEAAGWRYEQSLMPTSPLWSAETRILRMFNEGGRRSE